MATKTKRPGKKARLEEEERKLAGHIDDAVTWIECAVQDGGDSIRDGWFCGEGTLSRTDEAVRLLAADYLADPDDSCRQPGLGIWCHGEDRCRYEVMICSRPSLTERDRLARWQVIPNRWAPVYRANKVQYFDDGRALANDPEYYRHVPSGRGLNPWFPVWGDHMTPSGQTKYRVKPNGEWEIGERLLVTGRHNLGPAMCQLANWSASHLWHIRLSAADGRGGILFCTAPSGVKGFFGLRDKPDGMSRRSALLHWVRAHSRTRVIEDEEVESKVREHVRGRTEFDWFGLRGSVLEPPALTAEQRATVRESIARRAGL